MELSSARYLAEGVVAKLKPTCERILIAGSIRRQKKEVSDIDIVVIARHDKNTDMFGEAGGTHVSPEFISVINSWTKIKGDPTGKYTQRLLPEMMKLEISIASRETFGTISLIRTGDADFIHMLMIRARKLGFEQRDGRLHDVNGPIQLLDEADYFRILQLPFIIPELRDENAFKKLKV